MDAARGASFAADQDEGSQPGSRRPIPQLVSKIQVATTNAGTTAQGGLTPDFLALSLYWCRLGGFLERRLAGHNPASKTLAKHADRTEFHCSRKLVTATRAGALGLFPRGSNPPSATFRAPALSPSHRCEIGQHGPCPILFPLPKQS